MPKYLNTSFGTGKSDFTDVNTNTAGPNTALCSNQIRTAVVSGGVKVPMVSGSLTFNRPFTVDDCAVCPPPVLNESLKLQWNFPRGSSADLTALRTELLRLLDEWEASYELTKGLVPPVYADFAEE